MAFNLVEKVQDLVSVRNVLVSVFDKTGLEDFVRGLAASCEGISFYATGGSYEALRKVLPDLGGTRGNAGEARLISVSDYTGQGEMRGGLVKTLDWKIYLGLLAEYGDEAHEADLSRTGAVAFDMVVANLYPFEAAATDTAFLAAATGAENLRQRIDIGGPAMIRAAAKNYLRVASVSGVSQYTGLLEELVGKGGRTSLATRHSLAVAAFSLTSRFDAVVARGLDALDPAALDAAYHRE